MNGSLVLALFAALCYGAYNFFIKASSSSIDSIAGVVILDFIALIVGVLALLYLKITHVPLHVSWPGAGCAMLAGIFVGFAEIVSFYFFACGSPVMRGAPSVVGGSVVFSAILGFLILRERLSIEEWLGLALILIGIFVVTSHGRVV